MHDCDNKEIVVKLNAGDNMAKNEVRTITLKVSDNTKEKRETNCNLDWPLYRRPGTIHLDKMKGLAKRR